MGGTCGDLWGCGLQRMMWIGWEDGCRGSGGGGAAAVAPWEECGAGVWAEAVGASRGGLQRWTLPVRGRGF